MMLLKNLEKYNIVLASDSLRRQELLKELGLKFNVISSHAEESFPEAFGMTAIPEYLARLKASSVKDKMPENYLLITADTIVWDDNKVLGKPIDREDAISTLESLSGSQHQVITGMCIQTEKKEISFHAVTEVWFDNLTKEEIVYYVDKYKPYDKAGSYGIQEWIGYIGIIKIEGSFYNVMGLPVHKLYQNLKQF